MKRYKPEKLVIFYGYFEKRPDCPTF